MKWVVRSVSVATLVFGVATVAYAQTPSSANFQNSNSATLPAVFSGDSANFHVDASVEALVGNTASANFGLISGTALTVPAPVVPPVLLALAGRVPVKASLENGDILPGDALAPASIPGYVMKATAPGIILGRSLSGFSPDVDGSSRGEALLFIQAGYYVPPALSVQAKQSDEESDGLEQVTDPSTDSSGTSAEQILSDEGLSTSTGNVSTEQGTPTAAADSFDVKGAIDGILDSIKKLFECILGIEAKLEQQQQEIDELRAKIEAIQPQ